MSYIEKLEWFKCAVSLKKLGATTFLSDCSDELLVYLGCSRNGRGKNVFGPDGQTMGQIKHFSPCVWVCRIGIHGASCFGQSAEQAAKNAVLLELTAKTNNCESSYAATPENTMPCCNTAGTPAPGKPAKATP